jgi:hypothetical protein
VLALVSMTHSITNLPTAFLTAIEIRSVYHPCQYIGAGRSSSGAIEPSTQKPTPQGRPFKMRTSSYPSIKSGGRFSSNLPPSNYVGCGVSYLSSIRITSNGSPLRFSGRCSSGGMSMLSPAFQLRSSVRPSGNVNLPWLVVRNIATREGCPCDCHPSSSLHGIPGSFYSFRSQYGS